MPQIVTIRAIYKIGDDSYTIADDGNEFEDIELDTREAVIAEVRERELRYQKLGHEVQRHLPPTWPPSDFLLGL
jgi:hypothetical protein